MNVNLVIIDPQRDFCDVSGSLYVPGSMKDMKVLSEFISRNINKISNLFVSLDTHNSIHIAHSNWWVDDKGNNPEPFTNISLDCLKSGRWKCSDINQQEYSYSFLEKINNNSLNIWPLHCIAGSPGHNVTEVIFNAINKWEIVNKKPVEYITKGSSINTEHFSILQANVIVEGDEKTLPNIRLLNSIFKDTNPDLILISGEAKSHCVANTVLNMIELLKQTNQEHMLEKIIILEDTMSSVPGFEIDGYDFFNHSLSCGIRIMKTFEAEKIINENI